MPLDPARYAELLGQRLQQHGSQVWLINTGWTGGPQGQGSRIDLTHTRSMVRAVLSSELNGVPFAPDPILGVQVPTSCPGVPAPLLQPRTTWKNPADYDAAARRLTDLFRANPFHPSLHVEKLHPKHHEVWSFRVDRAYRVIFKFV